MCTGGGGGAREDPKVNEKQFEFMCFGGGKQPMRNFMTFECFVN